MGTKLHIAAIILFVVGCIGMMAHNANTPETQTHYSIFEYKTLDGISGVAEIKYTSSVKIPETFELATRWELSSLTCENQTKVSFFKLEKYLSLGVGSPVDVKQIALSGDCYEIMKEKRNAN